MERKKFIKRVYNCTSIRFIYNIIKIAMIVKTYAENDSKDIFLQVQRDYILKEKKIDYRKM